MANTKTLTNQMVGLHRSIIYLTLVSDGSQETNYVVYSSSTVSSALGITDPKNSTLVSIRWGSNSALGVCKLNWDATTPLMAWALPYQGNEGTFKFHEFAGLKNQGGAGKTGDITLTTTGLASGDSISLILEVRIN
jgi:hypothetical protein